MDSQSLLALADRIQLMNAQAIRQKVGSEGARAFLPQNPFDLGHDSPVAHSRNQAASDNDRDKLKGWHHQESPGLSGISGAKDLVRILGELGPSGSSRDVKDISGGARALPAGTSDWRSILGEVGHASAFDSAADRAEEWMGILSQGLRGNTFPGIDAQATATNTDTRMSSALNSILAPNQAPEFKSSAAVNPLPSKVDGQPQAAPNP
jgi:hypothetical protein